MENTEQKIAKLQLTEQSLQNFMLQKQQFQTQLIEIDSAMQELDKSEKSYKIIGNIMVNADKAELLKELKSKKETTELRIRSIEKQETNIKEKASSLQKEIVSELKEKKK